MRAVYTTVFHIPNVTRQLGNYAGGIMMDALGESVSVILELTIWMTVLENASQVSHFHCFFTRIIDHKLIVLYMCTIFLDD